MWGNAAARANVKEGLPEFTLGPELPPGGHQVAEAFQM